MGYAATVWARVTPGHISTPKGIVTKLEEFRDSVPNPTTPEGSEAWRAYDRAAKGVALAHEEWSQLGKTVTRPSPVAHPAPEAPQPPEGGVPLAKFEPPVARQPQAEPAPLAAFAQQQQPATGKHAGADANHKAAQPDEPSRHEQKTDKLIELAMTIVQQNGAILAMLAQSIGAPVSVHYDWDAMFRAADLTAEVPQ